MALSVSIDLVSSSARVTSVKSYKRQFVCDGQTDRHPDTKIGPGTPGSDKKKHEKSPCLVDAVPDSGCSGRTNISRDFARRAGICVLPSHYPMRAASNTDMEVSGMALISICVKGQDKMIHRQVSVTNITDDMLLSWPDLISLGVLPGNFPRPAPEY